MTYEPASNPTIPTRANGGLRDGDDLAQTTAEIADIDNQIADAYYRSQYTGEPVGANWLHKALEARRHRANKVRDLGGDPGRPPRPPQPLKDAEIDRLIRDVERLTREVERLTAENERITAELETWGHD